MLLEAVALFLEMEDALDGSLNRADYLAWVREWEARLRNLRFTYERFGNARLSVPQLVDLATAA